MMEFAIYNVVWALLGSLTYINDKSASASRCDARMRSIDDTKKKKRSWNIDSAQWHSTYHTHVQMCVWVCVFETFFWIYIYIYSLYSKTVLQQQKYPSRNARGSKLLGMHLAIEINATYIKVMYMLLSNISIWLYQHWSIYCKKKTYYMWVKSCILAILGSSRA